jgi:hypothetical protein
MDRESVNPPRKCPVCDGVDTFEVAGPYYLGFRCRDCDFPTWRDGSGRWQEPPRSWTDRTGALERALLGVGLLLHDADLLTPSERRQTLGKVYFDLKLVAPSTDDA